MAQRGKFERMNFLRICLQIQGGHWGFADSEFWAILGAEMRKSIIVSADCGYWLHFLRNAGISAKLVLFAKT